MPIVEFSIVPLGTQSTSISVYVAAVHKVLEDYKERVTYQLTPMSTIIEGNLADIMEIVQKLHEVPFENGAKRILTSIKIDDRRDKKQQMSDKIDSVKTKLIL
ncbi:hypothetical protein BHU72_06830 [Desulfuribacillus stibiiarsenatis]|uniref:Thiamine-binding protein domain-containing protein n=1 Tax=Desulfuribacillus stibiiarsenatis TaxID=1390249 RepID=A0A1E5L444_9FIRM|nr:MTH1187 family thiamine-binding protein [Desulfuribacillus stibiiarsenatis]OEH84902.1 hypothetical protein BHU72_06830 [Desulfuribacillus stibiiarsenatis]